MLVLTRHLDEAIMIGKDIKVTVVGIVGNKKVSLGFEAPQDVHILRDELCTETKTEPNETGTATILPTSEQGDCTTN